jgi:CheY-like chemotaxis protein
VNWVNLRSPDDVGQAVDSPTVLVVEHDVDTRTKYAQALGDVGFHVKTASSAASALAVARFCRVDFMLLGPQVTTHDLVEAVQEVVSGKGAGDSPKLQFDDRAARLPVVQAPRSAAERWAMLVLQACRSDGDLKTLADWAVFVGVSYSSLCEACRLVDVRPRDARDLARVLRAIIGSAHDHLDPGLLLDVRDRRTLRALLKKAGLQEEGCVPVGQFLNRQRFVAPHNLGLAVLRRLLVPSPGSDEDGVQEALARSPIPHR